jgi:hypothetical protein
MAIIVNNKGSHKLNNFNYYLSNIMLLKLNLTTLKKEKFIEEPIIQINRKEFIKRCNNNIKFNNEIKLLNLIINNINYVEHEEIYLSNIWVFNSNNILFVKSNNEFYLLLIKPLYN